MGSAVFSAQYQQSPVPDGGAMIRREWIRYYDQLPERTYRTKVIQSWDTAAKVGSQNDWSVCTTWLLVDKHFYLMNVDARALRISSTARHGDCPRAAI